MEREITKLPHRTQVFHLTDEITVLVSGVFADIEVEVIDKELEEPDYQEPKEDW